MDIHREQWNEQQQVLRQALSSPESTLHAISLFLDQHAMVHCSAVSQSGLYSFEDEIWDGLTKENARCIPPSLEHSIVWCLWHLTRCEDITMNMLVAGTPQLLLWDGWFERMKISFQDTGNAMSPEEIRVFSEMVDIPALLGYRQAVGRRTREIVKSLRTEEFKRKTDPLRLQQVLVEGAVLGSQQWLTDYWGGLTVAGLLLMPPTRHNLVHLNEAGKIKQKCTSRSP